MIQDYVPQFASFDNLSVTDLFPTFGPRFELVNVGHAHSFEVQITPSSIPDSRPPVTVGIFASVLPSWYFAAVASKLTVSWVVCLDPNNWDFFVSALDATIPLFKFTDAPGQLAAVHIIAVNDATPTRFFHRTLGQQALGCPLLIFDTTVRRPPPGYHRYWMALGHGASGGVSDGKVNFTFFSQDISVLEKIKSVPIPTYPNDALISLLSRTVGGSRTGFRASRVPSQGSSDTVLSVYSDNQTLYYGHGLCPLVKDLPTFEFLCPCVYPTTPWLRRRLTPHELGLVYDLPSSYTQRLGTIKLTSLTCLLQSPIKPMTVLFLHLFRYARPSVPSFPCNDDSAGPPLAPESDNSPGGGALSVPSGAVLDESPKLVEEVVTQKDSMVDDEVQRNAVAVKADDAPVPVFVWRKQLERILDITIPVDVYETGADLLRDKLLRMWRRGLLRHFWMWVRTQHQELDSVLGWCESQFGWSSLPGTYVPTKGKIVRWDRTNRKYTWYCKRCGSSLRFKNVGRIRYGADWKQKSAILGASREAVLECITKAAGCTWWKWDAGSRLFFWRWPKEYVEEARDGCKCWFNPSKLPKYLIPQRPPSNPEMKDKIREKLADVMMKLYIADGNVWSLTSFFDVLKGEFDIRMVYNGTSCGLNAACWAPWFPLPTVDTHLRSLQLRLAPLQAESSV